jgi:hypothetical protein
MPYSNVSGKGGPRFIASAGTSGVKFPIELRKNVGSFPGSLCRRDALVLSSDSHLRQSGNGEKEEPRVSCRKEIASREIGERVQE